MTKKSSVTSKCRSKNPEACPFHGKPHEKVIAEILAKGDVSAYMKYKNEIENRSTYNPIKGLKTDRPTMSLAYCYYQLLPVLSPRGAKQLESYNIHVERFIADKNEQNEYKLREAKRKVISSVDSASNRLWDQIHPEPRLSWYRPDAVSTIKEWVKEFENAPLHTTLTLNHT